MLKLETGDDPSTLHCRVCGVICIPPYEGYWRDAVCSLPCWNEFKWRETLRIVRKPYYPDPRTHANP